MVQSEACLLLKIFWKILKNKKMITHLEAQNTVNDFTHHPSQLALVALISSVTTIITSSSSPPAKSREQLTMGTKPVGAGTAWSGAVGQCQAYGVGVVSWQLGQRQARQWRPGSGVGDGGVDQVRWSRPTAAAQGGTALSIGHRGAGHRPRHRATGVDKWGSNDSNSGTPVIVTTNSGNLAAFYAKSRAFYGYSRWHRALNRWTLFDVSRPNMA
jgi:hypothetical protein